MYYSITLTLGADRAHCKNKDIEHLKSKIYEWGSEVVPCKTVLENEIWYDENDDGSNPHLNIILESCKSSNCVKKEFFFKWVEMKGFVYIKETEDIVKWINYGSRNDYKDPNLKNRKYIVKKVINKELKKIKI